jgi:OTU domain-containing protein 7
MTDIILTNFVSSTGVDPALAQDILDSHEWDLEAALRAFSDLKNSKTTAVADVGDVFKMPLRTEVKTHNQTGKPLLQRNHGLEVADESTGESSIA